MRPGLEINKETNKNKNNMLMKTKYFIFAASALVALASCSSNDFVGDESLLENSGSGAIAFSSSTPAITRATQEDAAAANALGNKFIVWGEKNESGKTAATATNTVFQNYTVEYGASTAYTTLSNTDDWEYVGKTSYGAKLTPAAPTTSQTIKYWDNGASSYTFTAISALDADISGDKVVITKNIAGSSNEYEKGYTIAVKEGASTGNIFFADRINDTPANLKNNAVKFSFRNLQAKMRFGIYETVPGHSVKIDKVYYNSTNSTTNFGVDGKFIKPAANTSFTVTYGDGTTGPQNKALVAVSADTYNTYLASTSTTIMSATSIGTASNTATLDDYVSILPYTSNTTDLSFTIDYTLKSDDTGETTAITGKTVKVPAAYCKWQSNYAYTYLFKITDSDLTPITFDACYVEDELGNQETITTVSEPSITTYAKGTMVTTKNEYLKDANIYVVVDKSGTVQELAVGTNVKLYTAKIEDGAAQGITEETVKNAIAQNTDKYDIGVILDEETSLDGYYTFNGTAYVACAAEGKADGTTTYYKPATYSVKDANGKKLVINAADGLTAITSIPATDTPTGVAITVNGAQFTPAAAGTYVIEFIDTADGNKKYYKVIKVVAP